MPTVLFVRHGRSTANSSATLAGWTPGISLDEHGRAQAETLPARLAGLPLRAVVSSPLQRCQETTAPLFAPDAPTRDLPLHTDERLGECHYGDWTGRDLAELVKEPLWDTVQQHPSAAAFPGPEGESLRAMQARAVDGIRDWNARIADAHGDEAMYLVCSHGDVIKSIVADALAMHLDLFQRITVEPGSVTAIRYTRLRPFLLRLGDSGDLHGVVPPKAKTGDGQGQTAGGEADSLPETPAGTAPHTPEAAVIGGSTGGTDPTGG